MRLSPHSPHRRGEDRTPRQQLRLVRLFEPRTFSAGIFSEPSTIISFGCDQGRSSTPSGMRNARRKSDLPEYLGLPMKMFCSTSVGSPSPASRVPFRHSRRSANPSRGLRRCRRRDRCTRHDRGNQPRHRMAQPTPGAPLRPPHSLQYLRLSPRSRSRPSASSDYRPVSGSSSRWRFKRSGSCLINSFSNSRRPLALTNSASRREIGTSHTIAARFPSSRSTPAKPSS